MTKSLPPDVMHEMLEGVFPLTMKHVICEAHRQKHITITGLNEELQKFCISQNDKTNKPLLPSLQIAGKIYTSISRTTCSHILSSDDRGFGAVLTPKCHYLVHYPRLILMYGPFHSL